MLTKNPQCISWFIVKILKTLHFLPTLTQGRAIITLFTIVLEILASVIKQEKEMKDIIGKEEL